MRRLQLIQAVWPGVWAAASLYFVLSHPGRLDGNLIAAIFFGGHALIAAFIFQRSSFARVICATMTAVTLFGYSASFFFIIYLHFQDSSATLIVLELVVYGLGMVLPAVLSLWLFWRSREAAFPWVKRNARAAT